MKKVETDRVKWNHAPGVCENIEYHLFFLWYNNSKYALNLNKAIIWFKIQIDSMRCHVYNKCSISIHSCECEFECEFVNCDFVCVVIRDIYFLFFSLLLYRHDTKMRVLWIYVFYFSLCHIQIVWVYVCVCVFGIERGWLIICLLLFSLYQMRMIGGRKKKKFSPTPKTTIFFLKNKQSTVSKFFVVFVIFEFINSLSYAFFHPSNSIFTPTLTRKKKNPSQFCGNISN